MLEMLSRLGSSVISKFGLGMPVLFGAAAVNGMLDARCSMSSRLEYGAAASVLDAGYWMLDTGCWMLDTGCSILDWVKRPPRPWSAVTCYRFHFRMPRSSRPLSQQQRHYQHPESRIQYPESSIQYHYKQRPPHQQHRHYQHPVSSIPGLDRRTKQKRKSHSETYSLRFTHYVSDPQHGLASTSFPALSRVRFDRRTGYGYLPRRLRIRRWFV